MANQRNNQNQSQENWKLRKDEVRRWIQDGFEDETINYTDAFGKFLVGARLTTSQIRNIFGEVKRLQGATQGQADLSAVRKDFLMLRPKLAYAAKRAGSRGIESLKEVMDVALKAVETTGPKAKDQFENFVDFFEAILAYHKAYGGRD
ncbi:MAG: type III-A CRISPR-associated protein Csm2 [Phaeodactylibacter sp.]|nr:type III-A CRISPR-associated protein Csm2 [Phaeodactylibacter sp.]